MYAASCAVCEATKTLTEHHIHPREYKASYPNGPERINEQANLVILCRACHNIVHEEKPFHSLLRETKNKLRRFDAAKSLVNERHDPLADRVQSQKDKAVQKQTLKAMIRILQQRELCAMIDSYRRIIRTVERIHLHYRAEAHPFTPDHERFTA